MTDRDPLDPDLPDWPDDVVVPDDLSALFGNAPSGTGPGQAADGATATPGESVPSGAAPSGTGGTGLPAESAPAEPAPEAPEQIVRTTAVVLTAVRQAKVLAGLMALQGIEAAVVPSTRGAIAVRYVEQLAIEVDPSEALSGIPLEAEALGAALSLATRHEVVLLAAHVDDVDGEIAGQVVARRYRGGQIAEDPPPGLVLAQADQVAERLLIGLVQAPQVSGYISSTDVASPRGGRGGFFGRRRKGEEDA